MILAVAAQLDLQMVHMDVSTAFLNADLDRPIWIKVPEGVDAPPGTTCHLQKALYGLRQSPRVWNSHLDQVLRSFGLKSAKGVDEALYFKNNSDGLIIIGVYVDDLLIAASNEDLTPGLKKVLTIEFDMKDLGVPRKVLGLEIKITRDSILVHQASYAEKLLKRFGFDNCVPAETPLVPGTVLEHQNSGTELDSVRHRRYREIVGSIMYLTTSTRPDLSMAISMCSRYVQKPYDLHWKALTHLIRYVRRTASTGIKYVRKEELEFYGYSDSSNANDLDTRKARYGYIFTLSGGAIGWASRLEDIITLSSTEAEYVAALEAAKEGIWISKFLETLGLTVRPFRLLVDNTSAIRLAEDAPFSRRTKHMEVRYYKLREWVKEHTLMLEYVSTKLQAADFMTKIVNSVTLDKLLKIVGVKEI